MLTYSKEAIHKINKINNQNWFRKEQHKIVERIQANDPLQLQFKNRKKKIFQLILMVLEKDSVKYLNIFKNFRKKKKNN